MRRGVNHLVRSFEHSVRRKRSQNDTNVPSLYTTGPLWEAGFRTTNSCTAQHLGHRLAGKELADLTHGALQGEQALHFPLPESVFALSGKPFARPALDGRLPPPVQEEEGTSFAPYTAQLEEALLLSSARDRLLTPADLIALKDLLAPDSVRVTPHYLQIGEEYVRELAVIDFHQIKTGSRLACNDMVNVPVLRLPNRRCTILIIFLKLEKL